jgi:Putative Ig domain
MTLNTRWSSSGLAAALLCGSCCLHSAGEPAVDAGPDTDAGPMDAGYCVTSVPPTCAGVLITLSPAFCDGGIYALNVPINQPFQFQLTATCGVPPYQWSLASGSGGLPASLQLDETGLISGVTTQPGVWPFAVTAMDSTGSLASGAYEVVSAP